MNWDWEKLQEKKQRKGPFETPSPDFEGLAESFKRFTNMKLPGFKLVILLVAVVWLLSGIYIVEPDEVGVVLRFGAFHRITGPGPHYRIPYPAESVLTPKVTSVQRVEIGFRTIPGRQGQFQQGQMRVVPEESLMLTGDENIIDVQFIVQYQIKDAQAFLFNVSDQSATVKSAAEAAMREVIGYKDIDSALTTGKLEIQDLTRELLQSVLDRYQAGIRVVAVQLQDVHPPKDVIDAFKDVASAREDKSRYVNEADAYRNDLLPKARGLAAQYVNQAKAYKESILLKAQGDASRFLAVLTEYNKAKDITRERLFLQAMETILSSPGAEKLVLSDEALQKVVPYLPLDRMNAKPKAPEAQPEAKVQGGQQP